MLLHHIFSWLSWLAVLLVARMHDGVMQDGSHAPANRLTETYSLGLKRHSLIPVKTKYLLTSTP